MTILKIEFSKSIQYVGHLFLVVIDSFIILIQMQNKNHKLTKLSEFLYKCYAITLKI